MADDAFPVNLLPCIARFLAEDAQRPGGLDLYLGVFATDVFFPLQRQAELSQMMRMARTVRPKTVMEIGADKGGGLYHWIKCQPTVTQVIACEVRGTPYASLFERAFPGVRFLWLPESSYDLGTTVKVAAWLDGTSIDCLFIDGDKSEFVRDFDCYRPLCADNGIVFMHDVTDEVPGAAFREVCLRDGVSGYRSQIILDISDSIAARQRERQGIPAASPHEAWLRFWQGRSAGVGVIYLGESV